MKEFVLDVYPVDGVAVYRDSTGQRTAHPIVERQRILEVVGYDEDGKPETREREVTVDSTFDGVAYSEDCSNFVGIRLERQDVNQLIKT